MARLLPLCVLVACIGSGERSPRDGGKSPLPPAGTHPFLALGQVEDDPRSHRYDAAVVLDAHYGAMAGKMGLMIHRLDGAEEVYADEVPETGDPLSGDNLSYDPTTDRLWMALWGDAGELDGVAQYDVSDRSTPVLVGTYLKKEVVRAISAHEGRVLVGTTDGALLIHEDATVASPIEVESAVGGALYGDRAVLSSGSQLLLFDVADPSAPTLLDELPLPADGWDVDFDGERLAVALGSEGVLVADVVEDTLVEVGRLHPPRSCFDLDLDGTDLWVACWSGAWLADVRGEPVLLGESPAVGQAMGIGAGYGRAMVGEIGNARMLQRIPGAGGAELTVTEQLWFPVDSEAARSLQVRNDGLLPLEVQLKCDGCTLDTEVLELAPGTRAEVEVVTSNPEDATLTWRSGDPSEPKGRVTLSVADEVVGLAHPDFDLEWFAWPEDRLKSVDQEDLKGRVTYLYYFKDT